MTADNPEQQVRVPLLEVSRGSACTGYSEDPLLAELTHAAATERRLLAWRRGRLAATRRWTIAALVIALGGALAIGAVARWVRRRALDEAHASETRYRELATKLEEISITDELTGLHNRRGFALIAGQALLLARRQDKRVAVLFADLDGLKTINDGLGHDEGDRAIRSGRDDRAAPARQARRMERRPRRQAAPRRERRSELLGTNDARSLDELVQAADEAMYVRKRDARAARAS